VPVGALAPNAKRHTAGGCDEVAWDAGLAAERTSRFDMATAAPPPQADCDRQPLFFRAQPRTFSSARMIALSSAVSGLCFGYEIGIVDSVLAMPSFKAFFSTSASVDGWIVSAFLLGCLLGTAVVSFCADRFGRKPCLLAGALLFIAGGLAQTGAISVATLCVGRSVSGCGIGALSMVAPLFITEISVPADRGALVALQQLLITIGILLASVVNSFLFAFGGDIGNSQWRVALAMQVLPGALLLVLALPLPRSPRWLVMVGRDAEASAVLARLRELPAGAPQIAEELAGIRAELGGEGLLGSGGAILPALGAGEDCGELQRLAPDGVAGGRAPADGASRLFTCAAYARRVTALAAPSTRKRTLLVAVLQFWQQWTGINVVLYFAARLFERAGADATHAATSLVVGNAVLLVVGTLISMRVIDRAGWGRRNLLLWGALAMAACHVGVAVLVGLADGAAEGSAASTALSVLSVACMFLFTLAFSATWGPVAWVVQNEVLPLHVRAQGCALGTAVNWASNSVM
jgi:MFS family permease